MIYSGAYGQHAAHIENGYPSTRFRTVDPNGRSRRDWAFGIGGSLGIGLIGRRVPRTKHHVPRTTFPIHVLTSILVAASSYRYLFKPRTGGPWQPHWQPLATATGGDLVLGLVLDPGKNHTTHFPRVLILEGHFSAR